MKTMSKLIMGICLTAGCSQPATLGGSEDDLTGAQCNYFAVDGRVQICHATGSRTKPYTILRVAEAACVNAHAGHAGDYVAIGDPSCRGGGCLPDGAPCDATLPCCDGLTCEAGTCVSVDEPPSVPATPSADHFLWQGSQEGLDGNGQACGGVIAAGMGDQAMCYTATDGELMCAGRIFQTTWGPTFADSGLRDVEQVMISGTVNSAVGNAICAKKADGTIWCMGYNNNAIHGYPSNGETSPSFVQWGSANDNYRMATGTWDQLCSLHTDGRIDCSGYGFGGTYHATTPVAGPGHHSLWVDEAGSAHIDEASTFRVSDGRATCRVTAAGLECDGNVYGTAGHVAAGGQFDNGGSTCWLDSDGRVECTGTCQGASYCADAGQYCQYFSGCYLGAPEPHFTSAPAIHLFTNYYGRAACAVLADGSLWCHGRNDPYGQGMLGTGSTADLAGDTMVAPPGSVRLPSCN